MGKTCRARSIWMALLAVIVTFLCVGCAQNMLGKTDAEDTKVTAENVDKKVEKLVSEMSLTEKVGQLVMIGIRGEEADEDALYMLHQFHFGGVVLFDRNMKSKAQVKALTESLQKNAEEKAPLFIATDEEGGEVCRMKDELPPPPSQLEIGRTGDAQAAKESAAGIARNLKSLGINVNFAPVADIGSLGTRHYSEDWKTVGNFVDAAADGYESEDELYALKHFPGIGKGRADTHEDTVFVNLTQMDLLTTETHPFNAVIRGRGFENNHKFFVMVSHAIYPQAFGNVPASLSEKVMKEFLRDTLAYRGIIITDDMEMGAVSKHYSFRELGVRAILAGADIVMVCHEYPHQQEVYMGILDAVKSGEISEERIDESVKRILKTKLLHLL